MATPTAPISPVGKCQTCYDGDALLAFVAISSREPKHCYVGGQPSRGPVYFCDKQACHRGRHEACRGCGGKLLSLVHVHNQVFSPKTEPAELADVENDARRKMDRYFCEACHQSAKECFNCYCIVLGKDQTEDNIRKHFSHEMERMVDVCRYCTAPCERCRQPVLNSHTSELAIQHHRQDPGYEACLSKSNSKRGSDARESASKRVK